MSIGGLGSVAASLAGTQLAQTKGAEVDRTQRDALVQQRRDQSDMKAENAAGIGETNGEDHETAERDADGRLAWKLPAKHAPPTDEAEEAPPKPIAPDRQSGGLLDLTG